MKRIFRVVTIASFLSAFSSFAQVAPVCDVTCTPGPDPTVNVSARTTPINDRGFGAGVPRRIFPPRPHKHLPAELVLGSSAYQYDIPLLFLRGRNGLNLSLAAHYNSAIWSEDTAFRTITFNADRDNPSYGFRIDFGFIDMSSTPYILTEPDGTKHAIDADLLTTTDGSNIKFDNVKLTATYRNGNVIYYQYTDTTNTFLRPVKIQDTNGNFISISYYTGFSINTITDTLGRQVVFGYDANGKLTSISFPASQATLLGTQCQCQQAGSKTIAITWGTTPLTYSFSNLTVKSSPANGTVINVITAITMPDGTMTQFSYGGWGIVNKIVQLSNKINQTNTNNPRSYASFLYPDPTAVALLDAPSYTQKTVSFDGSDTDTAVWSYSVTRDAKGNITSQTVTDPRGVITKTTLDSSGFPIETQTFASSAAQTANTALRTVAGTWLNNYPQTVTTTLDDGTSSKVTYTFDSNGNMTDLKQYHFDTSLANETAITYATPGANILDRPSDVLIKDGAGNIVSRTHIDYDQYATFPLKPYTTPAAVQHDEQNFSTSNTIRGNPTTITTYSNAAGSSGPVTKTLTYDELGNVVSVGGTCCVPQKITFNSDMQYAYPESIATGPDGDALTLVTSSSYDFGTGVVLSATDANNQVTHFTYDVDNRLTQTQFPDLSTVTTEIDDSSASPTVTSYNSLNSLETVATLDGMGRTLSTVTKNKTSGEIISTVATQYDLVHGTVSVSNPYAPGETPIYTVTSTDELGRVIQTTPPGNVGSSQASYSGATVTLTDAAGKQRKQFMDALGELVRVDEPGSTNGVAASGSLTISGTEQSASVASGGGATAGTASITFGGTTDRSTQILTHSATSGSASFTVNGAEQSVIVGGGTGCKPPMPCCISAFGCGKTTRSPWLRFLWTPPAAAVFFTTVYDSGTVTMTANGFTVQVSYGNGSSGSTIATALAGGFNVTASPVNAVTSGSNLTLTAKATGAVTDYAVSYSSATTDTTGNFTSPSFWITGPTALAGGTDNGYTTVYDTGSDTVSVTANGVTYTKNSSYGQSSTPSSIAIDLANQINADTTMNKVVIANASGGVLSLTTVATGAATNYPITASSATNSQYFTAGSTSFPPTPSGSFAFTPGQNGIVYDAGTVTVTLNGFGVSPYTQIVNYSQGSTTSSIASAVLGAFNSDPNSPVAATIPSATPNVINFAAKTVGADTNYALSIASATTQGSYFAQPSFSGTATGLSGGTDEVISMTTPVSTLYTYNARGQLTQVTQGQQARTYRYDDLGRLTSSAVPETANAATTFTYKDFGSVNTRTDPRGIVTTYNYDTLNRLKQTTYSDTTPPVTYTYGGAADASTFAAGRVTEILDASGTEDFQYDNMGRTKQVTRTIGGNPYTTQYAYSAGQLQTITYPSNRTLTITPDPIGRLDSIASNGATLLTVAAYNAAGEVTSLQYGDGLEATYNYNDQLQLQTLVAGTTTTPTLNLTYNYGTANNGQIQGITDNINVSQSTSYVYDELGRLKAAQTTDLAASGTWKLGFKYDRYGNRLAEIPQGGTTTMPINEIGVDPATNRILGYQYDAAGNMINDGSHTYNYDAENRLVSVDGGAETFVYDAFGMRVKKNSTVYIYDAGHAIAEYANGAAAGSPTAEYAGALATFSGATGTYFHHDHLSTRFLTNASGTVTGTLSQFPFGETTSGSSATKWAFTNYERDNAGGDSGLDYAYARFYSSHLGRFMSMDPLAGSLGSPQSLNRYAYVQNDPINLFDPTGMNPSITHVCLLRDDGSNSGFCVGSGGFVDGMWDPFAGADLQGGFGWDCNSVNCSLFTGSVTDSSGHGSFSLGVGPDGNPIWINNGNGEELGDDDVAELGLPGTGLGPAIDSSTPNAPNDQNQQQGHPCLQKAISKAVPGAHFTGTGQAVGGHYELNFTAPLNEVSAALTAFSIFGFNNGYRDQNVFMSLHINGVSAPDSFGMVSAQGHIDVLNPSTGLFGILGHTVVDLGVGNLISRHKALLDPKCRS